MTPEERNTLIEFLLEEFKPKSIDPSTIPQRSLPPI